MPTIEAAVCCPPDRPLNSELARRQVRTLPYYVYGLHKKSRWQRLRAAIGVLRACMEFRPDVVYVNQGGSYKAVLPAATLLNLPLVVAIRIFGDAACLERSAPRPNRLRGLIANSAAVEVEIRRFRNLAAIPLHRIYDAYAPLPPPPDPPERIANRIAYVGRLVPTKGVEILVRAIGVLNSFNAGAQCLIAGDGDRRFVKDMQEVASAVTSAGSLQWRGFVRDVVPLLRTCSVLAVPSHRETLGRVVFEAWDAGAVPVVFSGSGGAAEIVSASEGGVLYHAQEPESLAAALRAVLEMTQEQRTQLADNGRLWMAKNCNPESYGAALAAILTKTPAGL
jgi:glycosyltransferase involved in cell wall biosynthesis